MWRSLDSRLISYSSRAMALRRLRTKIRYNPEVPCTQGLESSLFFVCGSWRSIVNSIYVRICTRSWWPPRRDPRRWWRCVRMRVCSGCACAYVLQILCGEHVLSARARSSAVRLTRSSRVCACASWPPLSRGFDACGWHASLAPCWTNKVKFGKTILKCFLIEYGG